MVAKEVFNELDAAIWNAANTPDALLDQFSTSHDFRDVLPAFCSYRAPYFAYKKRENVYGLTQGCCNHWDCPRCGIMRAKHEYGRIVEGCRTLATKYPIYFLTITCRGKELKKSDAENNYLKWTNRLLNNLRDNAKSRGLFWCYVQVTERQRRGHPHSHILTVWYPQDLQAGKKRQYTTDNAGKLTWKEVSTLRSEYLQKRVTSAGLGEQYDISEVGTVEGASRYVAKYMFKPEMFKNDFPAHWKRVRYSQSFPKLPDRLTEAFVLLTYEDWQRLAREATVVQCTDESARHEAEYYLANTGVLLTKVKQKQPGALLSA